jgi:hypothetical protein
MGIVEMMMKKYFLPFCLGFNLLIFSIGHAQTDFATLFDQEGFKYTMTQILIQDLNVQLKEAVEKKTYEVTLGPVSEIVAKYGRQEDYAQAVREDGDPLNLIINSALRKSCENLGLSSAIIKEFEPRPFDPKDTLKAQGQRLAYIQKAYGQKITLHLKTFSSLKDWQNFSAFVLVFGTSYGVSLQALKEHAEKLQEKLNPYIHKYSRPEVIAAFAKEYTDLAAIDRRQNERYNNDSAGMWKGAKAYFENTVKVLSEII